MKSRWLVVLVLVFILFAFLMPDAAYANTGTLARGLIRTLTSVLEIPKAIIDHSSRILFPFGIVTGTLEGAVRMVGGILLGGVEIVQGAAPYAKYAMMFL